MKNKVLPQITQHLLSMNETVTILNVGIQNYVVWIEAWFKYFEFEYWTLEHIKAMERFGADTHFYRIDEVEDESLDWLIAFGIWNYGTVKSQEKELLEKFVSKLKKGGIMLAYFNDHYGQIKYESAGLKLLKSPYFPKNPLKIEKGTFQVYKK